MRVNGPAFWLRWSWRDFRSRWALVVAISLLLAGGTGLAAGLGSMESWRVSSNDESYAALKVHDLLVETEEGSFVKQGSLAAAAGAIPDAGNLSASSETLSVPTQVSISDADGGPVIKPGDLIGVESLGDRRMNGLELTGPGVDAIALEKGTGLPAGRPRPVALVNPLFAEDNGVTLPAAIRLAGGVRLDVAGFGTSPETFLTSGTAGGFTPGSTSDPVFTQLAVAQEASGHPGQVNRLALRISPGTDPDAIEAQLARELNRRLPDVGVTISGVDEIAGRSMLYDDAKNDQQLFDIFAYLILAGAAFGAFNLISRTIEAQRREIGIGMALGVRSGYLSIRPLLMGLQISVLGLVLGVAFGLAVNDWLRGVLQDMLPLPVLDTDLRAGTFARWAVIGFLIPLIAAAWPVVRGIRVTPIEAIRVGFTAARGGGMAPLLAKLPLPGNTIAQMAPRNVFRAPRRTFLTVLAAGAVIAVTVSMSGMLDSFSVTVDRSTGEQLSTSKNRLNVSLSSFLRSDGEAVRRLEDSPLTARSEPSLILPARLLGGDGREVEVNVQMIRDGNPVWQPSVVEGSYPEGPDEILIARKAAEDLGVGVGDEISLSHPRQVGPARVITVRTPVRVSGIHPDPFRFSAFLAPSAAAGFGLAGRVNGLAIVPKPGVGESELQRNLMAMPGVASIEPASAMSDAVEEAIDDFTGVIVVVLAIAVGLVLLIAFNSTAINAEERSREYATMFASGIPVRTVLRVSVVENLIMGVIATVIGMAIGLLILGWVVNVSVHETLPELGVVTSISAVSVLEGVAVGVGAMALAPLLTIRRLRRMDVPDALRVVE